MGGGGGGRGEEGVEAQQQNSIIVLNKPKTFCQFSQRPMACHVRVPYFHFLGHL